MPNRPNILLITTDQQRFDALGCYGNPHIFTPHLDRLAQEGARFEHVYTPSPVCAPARGSIVTGRYPHSHRLQTNGGVLPRGEVLFSKLLANAGYDCGLIGKQHLGPCEDGRTEARLDDGFRVFEWCHAPFHSSPHNAYLSWLEARAPEYLRRQPGLSGVFTPGLPAEHHMNHWAAERTIAFIQQPREGPFFAWMSLFDPHHAFDPPERFRALYDKDRLPRPAFRPGELQQKPPVQQAAHLATYAGRLPGYADFSADEIQEMIARYYAMVSHVDAEVGRVLDALSEQGAAEDTLVLFTSDHGDMLGDHGLLLKGPFFYEGAVRVPLLTRWPGQIDPGTRCGEMTSLVDLAPTLLDAADVAPHPAMQGASLLPLCSVDAAPERPEWRDWALCQYTESNFPRTPPVFATMYRKGPYKAVFYHGQAYGELYDLAADPGEFDNRWDDGALRETREALRAEAFDRLVLIDDPRHRRIANW